MKGLFLNRWYEARAQFFVMCSVSVLIFFVNLIVIYIANSLDSSNPPSIGLALFALPFIMITLFTEIGAGSVTSDLKTHFLRYAVCGPISRLKYVIFYYTAAFAMVFFGILLGLISSVGIASIFGFETSSEEVSVIAIGLLLMIIFQLVQIPVLLKVKKYDISGMITFGIVFLIMYLINLISGNDLMGMAQSLITSFTESIAVRIAVALVVVVMYVASGAVSYYIMKKEDI